MSGIIEAMARELGTTEEQVLSLLWRCSSMGATRMSIEVERSMPPSYAEHGYLHYLPPTGREFSVSIMLGEAELVSLASQAAVTALHEAGVT